MNTFSTTEQQILDIIQSDFPLAVRPYQAIGQRIGKTEQDVINILWSLKERQIIRQISAIFNGKFFGFDTALISFQIAEHALERTAQIVNAHPGVSHNYQRKHPFNLWFTLSVPHALDMTRHVQTLARLSSCSTYLYLPGVKTFKRRVQFDMTANPTKLEAPSQNSGSPSKMSSKITLSKEIQYSIMDELQKDLPLISRPFADIARQFQIEEEELFQFLAYLKTSQKMSRFAAILYHRNIGYNANVMVVWDVPEEIVQAFGEYAAEQREISHCYERVTYPEWPYNFYTMIHGRTHEFTQQVIDALAGKFQITSYERLESGKEFKKQSVNYFRDDITVWHRKWVEGKAV